MKTKELIHPQYRADIDGLRAVAILAVVGFHSFPNWIKGGFIGVDVFFIISGFLISTIIFNSLDLGVFSFIEFYSRRIRRIFPALLVVMFACLAFGWVALFANEFKQLGTHIVGGLGFVSNFILWHESGYFDNAADTKPLLHLWSLSIEEQFYIIWPLIVWAIWQKRFKLLIITGIAGISFVFNVYTYRTNTIANFYCPLARFWELMVGSLLAYIGLYEIHLLIKIKQFQKHILTKVSLARFTDKHHMLLKNIQSILGMMLIIISVFLISKEKPFPGFWALMPVLGAVMIINAGLNAWVNRVVLSNRLLVFIGLISFPLYLWHWPIFSFARITQSTTPDRMVRILAIFIAILLAWLTTRVIEEPMRFGEHTNAKTLILLVLMLVCGMFGYIIFNGNGFEFREANTRPISQYRGELGADEFFEYLDKKFYPCQPEKLYNDALTYSNITRCFQSQNTKDVDVVILGDSHAEHLFLGLAEQIPMKNIAYYLKSTAAFIDNNDYDNIFSHIFAAPSIKIVIISMNWAVRTKGMTQQYITEQFSKTLQQIITHGKTVYISDDVPGFSFEPVKCKYNRIFNLNHKCIEDLHVIELTRKEWLPIVISTTNEYKNIEFLQILDFFCTSNNCSMTHGRELLYRDNNHLNINGSKYLGKRLLQNYPQLRNP